MNVKWPALFSELLAQKKLENKDLKLFALYTLYGSTKEVIIAVNIDKCLENFISQNKTFLDIENPRIECIISGLELLNIFFVAIDEDTAHQELLRKVYENCLYQITYDNITIMLKNFYKLDVNSEFLHRNYSLILSKPNSPLAKFVNHNIIKYITVILEKCDDRITDDNVVALSVLNNENIPIELKQHYISLLKTKLSLLVDVKDTSLWKDLLKSNDAITYSEKNVFDYFISIGDQFDDSLTNWINQQIIQLDFSENLLYTIDDEKRGVFLNAVVQCNSLIDNQYSEITKTIERNYIEFSFTNIKDNKMSILINNNIIVMNSENLEFLRENYSNEILYQFITLRIDEYTKMIERKNELIDNTELEYIISTKSGVSLERQFELLKFKKGELSIKDKPYSEPIKLYILTNNFSEDDYKHLVESYDNFSGEIKKTIISLFINRIDKTIEQKYSISRVLFVSLMNSNQLNEEQRKHILALALPNIGPNECIKYLSIYGFEQFVDIYDRNKKPQFENTKLNKSILDYFIKWHLILGYNISENGRIYIRRL